MAQLRNEPGPSQPKWFRISWLLVVLTLCDLGVRSEIPLCVVGSYVGMILQPLLLSICCVYGRGPVLTRYCVGLGITCCLWLLKMNQLRFSDRVYTFNTMPLLMAVFMLDHFLLLPIGLWLGAKPASLPTATSDRPRLRFELRDMLLAMTSLAVTLAMLRAWWPREDHLGGHFDVQLIALRSLAVFIYPLLQSLILVPMMLQFCGQPSRIGKIWLLIAVVAICVLAFVQVPDSFAIAAVVGMVTLFEFWMVLAAMYLLFDFSESAYRDLP